MKPSSIQVSAAVQTLAAAGFSMHSPSIERVRSVSAATVAELLEVSVVTARGIMRDLPGTTLLPGGDLRARLVDLESYLDARPAGPVMRGESKSA